MVAAIAGVVFALIMIPVFNTVYRCPRSGANFLKLRKQQFGWFSGETRMFWQVWDTCPHCGISFDDPWP